MMTDEPARAGDEGSLDSRHVVLCVLILVVGFVLRWMFTLHWHDPRDFVYSDMKLYVETADRMAAPDAVLEPADVTHPPATAFLLSRFRRHDATLGSAVAFQLAVSAATPLAVGALGWVAFGLRTGALAAAASSLYFPFIQYGGFFLAEVHFTFLLAVTLTLLLAALSAPRRALRVALALGAGLGFAAMVAFKAVAIPALGAFWLARLALSRRRGDGLALAAFVAGALPLLVLVSGFCTEANDGRFCVAGNKGPSDFLLGHYGRIGRMEWTDYQFGNPPAVSRGYGAVARFDFSLTDGPANLAEGWYWIRKHPFEALVLSLDHVYDTFAATPSWPGESTSWWAVEHLSAHVYLVFLFAPLAWGAVERLRRRGLRALLRSRELLLFSPLFGLVAAVVLTSGEPRYRNPFDAIFIVIACSMLVRALARRRAAPEATADPPSFRTA